MHRHGRVAAVTGLHLPGCGPVARRSAPEVTGAVSVLVGNVARLPGLTGCVGSWRSLLQPFWS